jgi:predicted KAP-like P-loop ATPase
VFLADEPIPSAAEDILGRKPFAEALAQAILAHKDKSPLVIGLLGPWGTGKSSLVRLTEEIIEVSKKQLEVDDQPIVIHFNPWMFADQTSLVNQFFDHLITALGKWHYVKELKRASRLLKTYSDVFSPLGLVPTAEGKVVGIVTKSGGALSKFLAWFASLADSIDQQKENIDKALREQNHKIIMFVDEIDRLSNQEVRQLFQVVKSVANFSQVIYVLAFDDSVVARQIADLHPGVGVEFLEKIIQVPFYIPKIQVNDVHRYLKNGILNLLQKWESKVFDRDHLRDIFNHGLRFYITNLREAKRFLNVLAFTGHVSKDIYPTDLVAITALQVFEPVIYERVRENKDFLTSGTPSVDEANSFPVQDALFIFNNIVKNQKRGSEGVPGSLLRLLFPKMNMLSERHGGALEFSPNPEWRLQGRICDPATFDLFFKLSLPKGEFTRIEIDDIMAVISDPTLFSQHLARINREGRIRTFLESYSRYLISDRVPSSAIPTLINVLADMGDTFRDIVDDDERELVFRVNMWNLTLEIIKQTAQRIEDGQEQTRMVLNAIRSAKSSLFIPIIMFSNVLSSPEAAKTVVRDKIAEWARDGRLLRHPRIGAILNIWEMVGGKEKVNEFSQNVLGDELALICLLWDYASKKPLIGLDYYSKPEFEFSLDSLRQRLDLRIAYERMRNIKRRADFSDRPKRERELIGAFLQVCTEYKPS